MIRALFAIVAGIAKFFVGVFILGGCALGWHLLCQWRGARHVCRRVRG